MSTSKIREVEEEQCVDPEQARRVLLSSDAMLVFVAGEYEKHNIREETGSASSLQIIKPMH